MSSQPNQSTIPGQPATAPHDYSQVLHDLIGMGANLARTLHDAATAPASTAPQRAAPTPDTLIALAAAFDRTARNVRRCIALSRHLAKPVQPAPDLAQHRTQARKRILRSIEDAIGRDADSPNHAESLTAELRERLDAPDLEDDLATRPIEDIIADIRRDLGLAAQPGTNPWKRRTPTDLADLHARAAAPSCSGQAPTPAHGTQPEGHAVTPRSQPGPTETGNSQSAGPTATIRRRAVPVQGGWHLPPVADLPLPPAHVPFKNGSG